MSGRSEKCPAARLLIVRFCASASCIVGIASEEHRHARHPLAGRSASSARRHAWGQAYRDGSLVCGRVRVTFARDERLGLAPRERRTVIARFEDRVDPALRAELAEVAQRRGAASLRAAERMEPIVLIVGDPRHDRERIVGEIAPPQTRRGDLRDIEFGLRELES